VNLSSTARRAAAALGALALVLTLPAAPAQPVQRWAPGWSDEFSGPAGAPPDARFWQIEVGPGNPGSAERQYYSADNATLDGQGHLLITARPDDTGAHTCWYGPCQYTSARINTAQRVLVRYGRTEARIKVPCGQGLWPAFWALGDRTAQIGWPDAGEIDVMEHRGGTPGEIISALHGPAGLAVVDAYTMPDGRRFCDDFHTFAADRYPNRIDFLVDGVVHHTRRRADLAAGWVFNHPFYLVLNLAVGGSWPGDPDATTPFPAVLTVDWVRTYLPRSTLS